jgi:hypothetical protein
VTGSFTLVTPLLSAIFGGQTIPMTSSATAQIQYLPDPLLITPPPAPVAAFTVSPSTGTVLTTFDFDASSSTGDPNDYQWDFGDGAQVVATTPTVSHTYAVPGSYTVILTVVNLSGVDTEQRTITVTVLPGPSGSVAPTEEPSPTCVLIPNVIGLDVASAKADLINAGFVPLEFLLTNGQKGRIQSQNPDHTECKAPGTSVQIWYRPN